MPLTLGTPTPKTSNSSPGFNHTVAAGDDRVLIVGMSWRNGDLTGAQFNGVAMTEIVSANAPSLTTSHPALRCWYLINPPVGTFAVTYATVTGTRFAGGAVVVYGAHQTTPIRTPVSVVDLTDTLTSSTLNPESAVGDLVLDFIRAGSSGTSPTNFAAGGGQTELINQDGNDGRNGLSWKDGAATQTSMAWTWTSVQRVVHSAVAIIPVGVLTPPEGTVTVGTIDAKSTSAEFPFSYNDTDETGYEYRIDNGSAVDMGLPSPLSYKIWNLTPSTAYNSPGLQVRAYNVDGSGEWSTAVPFSTIAIAPPVFARLNKTLHVQSKIEGEPLTSGSTRQLPLNTSVESGTSSARGRKPITDVTVLRNAFVRVIANTATHDSTITIIDNEVATAVVVTIPAGQTGIFKNTVNEHTFDGTTDAVIYADSSIGGTGEPTIAHYGFELQPTDNDKILSWIGPHSSGEDAPGPDDEFRLMFGTRSGTLVEANAQFRTPEAVTARDLRFYTGRGDTTTEFLVGVRLNGADTALVLDTADDVSDQLVITNTVDTVAVPAGGEICLFSRPDPAETEALRDGSWFLTLASTRSSTSGAFFWGVGRTGPGGFSVDGSTPYVAVAGEGYAVASEATAQVEVLFPTRVYGFTVRTAANNTDTGVTVALRKNGADTQIQTTIDATGLQTYTFPLDEYVDFEAGDLINYRVSGACSIQSIVLAGAAISSGTALEIQSMAVALAMDAPVLTQANTLAVNDAAVALSMDSPVLSTAIDLDIAALDIAVSMDAPTLVQANLLAVDDALLAVAMDAPTLIAAGQLSVQDAAVSVAMDAIGLIQANTLAVDGMATAVAMDAPALTQSHLLAVDDAAVAVAMDGITLSTGTNLLVDDMSISVSADNITLTQAGLLVVQGVDIPVSVDAVNLTQAGTLTVADLFASVGMEAPTLTTGGIVLAVQNAQIAVTMDSPLLTQSHILSVQDVQIVVTMGGTALVVAGATFPYPRITMNRTTRITMRH